MAQRLPRPGGDVCKAEVLGGRLADTLELRNPPPPPETDQEGGACALAVESWGRASAARARLGHGLARVDHQLRERVILGARRAVDEVDRVQRVGEGGARGRHGLGERLP